MALRNFSEDDLFRPTEDGTHPSLELPLFVEDDDSVAVGRFRLAIREGNDAGMVVASEDTELTIGAAPKNHMVLRDPTVSRHHCVITVTGRGFFLRDLGSRNGTLVNGVQVESAYLQPGAELRLGMTTMVFETVAEPLRQPISRESNFGEIIGHSPAMRRIFAMLPRVAAADTTVLLEGETGTGKGMMAEGIHAASPRVRYPFVVVDCGAIPPALFESELFGHERGAFTGANNTRVGAFEAAQNGTVFIDEIGELPLDLQPKLLRALDRRRITRVGGSHAIDLNVRVIAATNRDLRQEVNRGRFRADLYYRLNIVHMRLPSLAERVDDVPLLVQHLYAQRAGGRRAPASLVERLAAREWPGNVRELRNAIERIVVLDESDAGAQTPTPMPRSPHGTNPPPFLDNEASFGEGVSFRSAKENIVSQWERSYLKELLRRNRGVVSRAAREAHMDRNHLRDLLRRHSVEGGATAGAAAAAGADDDADE
jgi:DNA-binding NtrC family response regulator